MKKMLVVFVVLLTLFAGMTISHSGSIISGKSEVYVGETYTYTAKYSVVGADMVGKITGINNEVEIFYDSASGLENENLSGSTSIKVKIPNSANVGDKFIIEVYGQYSIMDVNYNPIGHTFSETKIITVVAKTVEARPVEKIVTTPEPSIELDHTIEIVEPVVIEEVAEEIIIEEQAVTNEVVAVEQIEEEVIIPQTPVQFFVKTVVDFFTNIFGWLF